MKNGRYDSTKSSSSHARSHYQPSRDHTSRYTSSRYSDFTSSKSRSHTSMFRGLFEKTFSRFFGGRLKEQFAIYLFCLLRVGFSNKIYPKRSKEIDLRSWLMRLRFSPFWFLPPPRSKRWPRQWLIKDLEAIAFDLATNFALTNFPCFLWWHFQLTSGWWTFCAFTEMIRDERF